MRPCVQPPQKKKEGKNAHSQNTPHPQLTLVAPGLISEFSFWIFFFLLEDYETGRNTKSGELESQLKSWHTPAV